MAKGVCEKEERRRARLEDALIPIDAFVLGKVLRKKKTVLQNEKPPEGGKEKNS